MKEVVFSEYGDFLNEIKERVREAQVKTVLAANGQMLYAYWLLGRALIENCEQANWGSKILERISADLKEAFPNQKGFSVRNLKYMRSFARLYSTEILHQCLQLESSIDIDLQVVKKMGSDSQMTESHSPVIGQQPVAQLQESLFMQSIIARISWAHHVVLIDKEPDSGKRIWNMFNAVENGVSRNVLAARSGGDLVGAHTCARWR